MQKVPVQGIPSERKTKITFTRSFLCSRISLMFPTEMQDVMQSTILACGTQLCSSSSPPAYNKVMVGPTTSPNVNQQILQDISSQQGETEISYQIRGVRYAHDNEQIPTQKLPTEWDTDMAGTQRDQHTREYIFIYIIYMTEKC